MTRLILFDVDGTLLDSQHMIVAAIAAAFAAQGMPAPSRAESLAGVGLSLPLLFRRLAGAQGPVEALAANYKAAWKAQREAEGFVYPLFAGADTLVRSLARRDDIVLGIATGKSRAGVADLCRRCGWGSVFATLQTADDAPSKPSPVMIEQALRATAIEAKHCVMIGDTHYDMAMARAAGVQAIGVAWGYHTTAQLVAAGAQAIASDFDELADLLA